MTLGRSRTIVAKNRHSRSRHTISTLLDNKRQHASQSPSPITYYSKSLKQTSFFKRMLLCIIFDLHSLWLHNPSLPSVYNSPLPSEPSKSSVSSSSSPPFASLSPSSSSSHSQACLTGNPYFASKRRHNASFFPLYFHTMYRACRSSPS